MFNHFQVTFQIFIIFELKFSFFFQIKKEEEKEESFVSKRLGENTFSFQKSLFTTFNSHLTII